MPEIVFITTAGDEVRVGVPVGMSLMRGAIESGIDEIRAECGGVASCGTCKIILDEANQGKIAPASAIEGSMLEDDPSGYRLSCQIVVDAAMDGLVVRVAPAEY
ncbi:2Fe-2S iron-sulfur cluster-binding protein [Sphingobium sp. BS19]|uniref:2Fe-2S iron-sulfur cluster-binding protein n=1 Tax=Sphingobium sp. BS19 TaxID=3018973 RepID=UPI0022EF0D35|nr:2Fe-2S iron-sulfur cluster-binding protein [Sphingobium sp. BS19]GLJ00643.1 2Fe-2S ferredoxin [Sphingobium sp. BS19]